MIQSLNDITKTSVQGETESYLLDFAKKSNGAVEACIAKPGIIDAPGRTGLMMGIVGSVFRAIIDLPILDVRDMAATLLEQAVNGIEKETLLTDDLVRIGKRVLAAEKVAQ